MTITIGGGCELERVLALHRVRHSLHLLDQSCSLRLRFSCFCFSVWLLSDLCSLRVYALRSPADARTLASKESFDWQSLGITRQDIGIERQQSQNPRSLCSWSHHVQSDHGLLQGVIKAEVQLVLLRILHFSVSELSRRCWG